MLYESYNGALLIIVLAILSYKQQEQQVFLEKWKNDSV